MTHNRPNLTWLVRPTGFVFATLALSAGLETLAAGAVLGAGDFFSEA